MNLLLFLLVGLLAGLVVERAFVGRRAILGAGVAGAFLGGFLVPLLGLEATGPAGSLALAAAGAVLLAFLARLARRDSPAPPPGKA